MPLPSATRPSRASGRVSLPVVGSAVDSVAVAVGVLLGPGATAPLGVLPGVLVGAGDPAEGVTVEVVEAVVVVVGVLVHPRVADAVDDEPAGWQAECCTGA
jgi:hypothetical protein